MPCCSRPHRRYEEPTNRRIGAAPPSPPARSSRPPASTARECVSTSVSARQWKRPASRSSRRLTASQASPPKARRSDGRRLGSEHCEGALGAARPGPVTRRGLCSRHRDCIRVGGHAARGRWRSQPSPACGGFWASRSPAVDPQTPPLHGTLLSASGPAAWTPARQV